MELKCGNEDFENFKMLTLNGSWNGYKCTELFGKRRKKNLLRKSAGRRTVKYE